MEIEPEVSLAGVSGSFHVVIRQLWISSREMEDSADRTLDVFQQLYLLAVALTRAVAHCRPRIIPAIQPGYCLAARRAAGAALIRVFFFDYVQLPRAPHEPTSVLALDRGWAPLIALQNPLLVMR